MFKVLLSALIMFSLASVAYSGTTWTVDDDAPADFSSIQVAIDFSQDGDVVEVQQGTYFESAPINFLGRAITLTSTDPNDDIVVENTWINSSIRFDNGEDNASILMGFKITQRIDCYYSNPTISHCNIRNVIDGDNAAPLISNCKFDIAGSRIVRCDGLIINCFFSFSSIQ